MPNKSIKRVQIKVRKQCNNILNKTKDKHTQNAQTYSIAYIGKVKNKVKNEMNEWLKHIMHICP